MITAVLTISAVWCLYYGRIDSAVLALLCAGLGTAVVLLGGREHTQFLSVDVFAQSSRLKEINPALKFWVAMVLIALCVASQSAVPGVFLTIVVPVMVICGGGLAPREYMHMLSVPVSFLAISGIALLFEVTEQKTGVLGVNIFGLWFCVSAYGQERAELVMGRSLGAVSCLYMLSLTTPISDLIGVLRRARCPDIVIELMYLTYRYVFILLSMHYTMRNAASSRLGYTNFKTGLRTTGALYSNLLSRGIRQAIRNFDAMESRCYDTGIRFLETRAGVKGSQAVVAGFIVFCTFSLAICTW